MRYLGGKSRTYKQVAEYLESVRQANQPYLEPFVGGAWVLQEMSGVRYASDGNKALIAMYKSLQQGWIPPDHVSEEQYKQYKSVQDLDEPITAFVGFGCSFSGKWFGGYARSGERNYAANAKNSLLKQLPKIQAVKFAHKFYDQIKPKGFLIYCDPPYSNTTGYGAVGDFDSDKFWQTMREWSEFNTVVISEYKAPEDFKCVLAIPTKTDMHTKTGKEPRVEKLFVYTN